MCCNLGVYCNLCTPYCKSTAKGTLCGLQWNLKRTHLNRRVFYSCDINGNSVHKFGIKPTVVSPPVCSKPVVVSGKERDFITAKNSAMFFSSECIYHI